MLLRLLLQQTSMINGDIIIMTGKYYLKVVRFYQLNRQFIFLYTGHKKPSHKDWVRYWSGKRDSNSRPRPWQGRALPAELFPLRIIKNSCQ